MYVTVWAVVELGWTTVYGPPLHLGPVETGRSDSGRDSGGMRGEGLGGMKDEG
jgi:hypothetical protein